MISPIVITYLLSSSFLFVISMLIKEIANHCVLTLAGFAVLTQCVSLVTVTPRRPKLHHTNLGAAEARTTGNRGIC